MSAEQAIGAAIAGEDSAVYAYGVIGAQCRGAEASRARRALADHRARRQQLQSLIAETVPAASAYDLPFAVDDEASAMRLAVVVENRMAALLADVAAQLDGERRAAAVTGAMECAARAVAWGGAPEAFPGR